MADSHPCGGHAHRCSGHIRHRTLHVIVMVVWRRCYFLVEDAELVFFSLKIVVAVIAELAVGTGLMRPTMPRKGVSSVKGGALHIRCRRTYCARLSDLENALVQWGQTYGRSCVCVLTCLTAEELSAAAEIKGSWRMLKNSTIKGYIPFQMF